jgi:hypothetical protein
VIACQARQCNGMVSASVPSQSKMMPRGSERWGFAEETIEK